MQAALLEPTPVRDRRPPPRPSRPPWPRRTDPTLRFAVAVAAGLGCVLAVLLGCGLLTGHPRGTADNGDGHRLYCGAGITPDTPDGGAAWRGGVVLGFTAAPPCEDPMPSFAGLVLDVVSTGDGTDLRRVGVLYAALLGVGTAAATWVVTARRLGGALLVAAVVVPLAEPAFARLLLSTFSEPAGLLGAALLALGAAALASAPRGVDRLLATALVVAGGLVAMTAKPGYAPLGLVAVLVLLAAGGRRRWRSSTVAVTCLVLVAAPVLVSTLGWQERHYPAVNAHNLVYTLALTTMPEATEALGLPAAATAAAGTAYYPYGPAGIPGAEIVAADPDGIRAAVYREFAHRPAVLASVVAGAVQATNGRALGYLPSRPWSAALPLPAATTTGEQGAFAAELRSWLDGMRAPWWPGVVITVGLLTALAARRGADPSRRAATALGATCAAGALVLAVAAVLGDGWFEIAKHVWLAAYLVDVTTCVLVGLTVAAAVDLHRSRRRRVTPWPTARHAPAPGGVRG